jgi:hypothetical protein
MNVPPRIAQYGVRQSGAMSTKKYLTIIQAMLFESCLCPVLASLAKFMPEE